MPNNGKNPDTPAKNSYTAQCRDERKILGKLPPLKKRYWIGGQDPIRNQDCNDTRYDDRKNDVF
jgi:hypothetical protein